MALFSRKLFALSLFMVSSTSQMVLSMETMDNGNGTQTITKASLSPQQGEVAPRNYFKERQDFLKEVEYKASLNKGKKSTWTDWMVAAVELPYSFVATLVQPFVEDAPKVLEALQKEEEKIEKQGFPTYALSVGVEALKTAREHPLDVVSLVGGGAIGWGFSDPQGTAAAILSISNGLKNSKQIYQVASSIKGETYVDAALAMGLGGLAIYALTAPVVEAATVGTQIQINTASHVPESGPSSAVTTNGNTVYGWLDTNGYPVVRTFSGTTAVTAEIPLTSTATNTQATMDIACTTNGPCFGSWSTTTPAIEATFFWPNNGTIITGPVTVNPTTPTSLGNPVCVGFGDGTAGIMWGASSSAFNQILLSPYSSMGVSLNSPFLISNSSHVQGSLCIASAADGSASMGWVRTLSGGVYEVIASTALSDGTLGNQVVIANDTNTKEYLDCFTYTGGNKGYTWTSASSNVVVQTTSSDGAPVGSALQIPNAIVPSAAGLSGDIALLAVQNSNNTVVGLGLSSTGTAQTTQFDIPTAGSFANGAGNPSVASNGEVSFYAVPISGVAGIYGRSVSNVTNPSPSPSTSPSPSPSTGSSPSPSASPSPGYSSASTLTPGLFGFLGKFMGY